MTILTTWRKAYRSPSLASLVRSILSQKILENASRFTYQVFRIDLHAATILV